ncbi:MAG: sugar transferase [Planctomycetia bacterium]|nr:sugar transferase [Planctomycetia bacterium]
MSTFFNSTTTAEQPTHVAPSAAAAGVPRVLPRDAYSHEITARLAAGRPVVRPLGNRSLGYRVAKRSLDVAGALVLLAILSPLLAVVFIVLLVTTRGRPLFVQDRVGHCGRMFRMFKFRTMVEGADKLQHLVPNEQTGPVFKNRVDPRVTRLGRFLRSSTIDELPQLFNVLLGDMSLVGPRPPVAKEVVKYEPWQLERLSVKPGLTCLWQVSGRCEIGFEDWVRMDLWYVKHQSLGTDLVLLAKTPGSVLSRKGAY